MSLGRFYNAAQGSFRINVPGQIPFYVEPTVTYNQWDFQNTGGLLGRDVLSTQIRQQDTKLGAQLGVSPNYRSRMVFDVGAFTTQDNYTNSNTVSSADVLDKTIFRGGTAALQFARNTLNRKQYATAGLRVVGTVRVVTGSASFSPGSTSLIAPNSQHHQWAQLRVTGERYFKLRGDHHSWGYFAELTASGQGTFSNYRSSQTTAPVFAPLPDSRTLFMDAYRSPRYLAGGLRYTRPVLGKLEWRSEVFVHLIAQPLVQNDQQEAVRKPGLDRPRLTASTGLIFDTPVGPLALHARYYDDSSQRFGIFGHLGFLLFRGRALE